MIDFDTLVLGPAYGTFGQPAVLTLGQDSHDLVVIDNTRGVTVDEAGMIGVQTIRLAADVRRSDLTRLGLTAQHLVDGEIEFNETTWRIKSVLETGDELRLILIAPLEGDALMYLLTQGGDRRITEAGDYRILE